MRVWAALLLTSLFAAAPAAAEPVSVSYRAMAGVRPIGEGALTLTLEGNRYAASVEGLLTAPLTTLADKRAFAEVAGTLVRRALLPDRYAAGVARSRTAVRVAVTFADGAVGSLSIEPRAPPDPKRIPLAERHRRGVVDPVSALIVPAAGPGYAPLSACSRMQAVFDGWTRYDVALFPSRVETVVLHGTPLTTFVCRLRSQPVAGHLRAAKGSGPRGLVWLSAVGDGRLMVPLRIEADFGFGRLVIEAKDARPFGAAQHEAGLGGDSRDGVHSASTFSASHTLISDW